MNKNTKDTRKNIYFAGHMEIDFENIEFSNLTRDYRCCIVDSEKIMVPFEPIPLNNEYAYGWPSFYYLDEEGKPSISSKLIADKEFEIIKNIDVFVAFLGDKPSGGTIGEIMYAAMNKKKMYIYYTPSPTESEVYHTNQWYPIMMAERINPGNVKVTEVKDITDLLNHLQQDFGIKPLRYPNK